MESSMGSVAVIVDVVDQSSGVDIEEKSEGVVEKNDVAEVTESENMAVDNAPGEELPEVTGAENMAADNAPGEELPEVTGAENMAADNAPGEELPEVTAAENMAADNAPGEELPEVTGAENMAAYNAPGEELPEVTGAENMAADNAPGEELPEVTGAENMAADNAPGEELPEVVQEGNDSVVAFECRECTDNDDDNHRQEDSNCKPLLQALDLRLNDPETGGEVAQDDVEADTGDAENTKDVADRPDFESSLSSGTECTSANVHTEEEEMKNMSEHQHDAASEEEETGEVMFVCVHGQTFRCKPQVGTPIKGSGKKPLRAVGSCSCSKSQSPDKAGEGHGSNGDKNQKFTCGECGGRFTQKASLERHMTAHAEEEKNAAQTEKNAEEKPKQMKIKMDRRTTRQQKQENPSNAIQDNICPECGKNFKRKATLETHKKQHDKEKVKKSEEKEARKKTCKSEVIRRQYQCQTCNAVFPSKYKLDRHEKSHLTASFTCDECPKMFNRLFKLERHKKAHLNKEENGNTEPENLSCKECSKVFARSGQLKRHELLHVKEKDTVFNCATCSETFEDKFSYRAHKKMHAIQKIYREVKCEICEKVVKGPATLRRHMRTHTKERPYPCRNGCKLFFASTSYRISHERLHCKMSEKCLCTHCGEVFSNKGKLLTHESKFHPDELDEHGNPSKRAEYPCRYCGRIFYFSAVRVRHERIHTNEKPYICQYCPKSFSHRNSLICHERVHTKERPYKCEVCGKTFSQASHCKTHMRIHTREKPYCCRYCSKAFSHIGTRKSHENTHLKISKVTEPIFEVASEENSEVAMAQDDTNPESQECEMQEEAPQEIPVQEETPQEIAQETYQEISESALLEHEFQGQEVTIQGDGVTHRIILQHPEHELQAADVILQLIERGSRVANLEGVVQILPTQ